jgi:CubicO group peptidase (beta-lactamase class C family)
MRSRFDRNTTARTLAFILAFSTSLFAQYFPPPDHSGGWRTLRSPAEIRKKTGLDVTRLDDAFVYIQGSSQHGGLLVVRHGWLVYERYFGRASHDATPDSGSCGKAFTSIAMGILMNEHPELFPAGLDQKVYTPRYLPAEAFPLNDPIKSQIKLGQLLAMTAGLRGNSPGYIHGKPVPIDPPGYDGWEAMVDSNAFSTDLWCKPGEGYCYATVSPHIVSAIVRHVSGMEMQEYLESRVAKPLGWELWGFGLHTHPQVTHTPGGGMIALRATDMLRFGYLLLHNGNWRGQQIVPRDYVRKATTPSPYNPHYSYSLDFSLNSDGEAPAAPRDAYYKGGFGGFALFVVPSLDMVIYKMGGYDRQYEQKNTHMPELTPYDGSRAAWTRTEEEDPSADRLLEKVVAALDKSTK